MANGTSHRKSKESLVDAGSQCGKCNTMVGFAVNPLGRSSPVRPGGHCEHPLGGVKNTASERGGGVFGMFGVVLAIL